MHILLIHQAFAHPDEPGGTRHYELARRLVQSGHRVTIVASDVTYQTGKPHDDRRGDGSGVDIVRVRTRGRIHRTYGERALSFVDFAVGALRAARRVGSVDVIWGTSPPLVQLLPAWLASLRVPGGLVFEERDLWPEFAVGMGILREGPITRAAVRFKRMMYRKARCIVVNSPGFVPFVEAHGVPRELIDVVPNGVDAAQFDPAAEAPELRREWGAEDRFVVLYAGAFGPANDLELVLDAADRLRGTPALFVLVGDGKERTALVEAASARQLDNVRFVPSQPKRAMPRVLAAADACLASLRAIPLFTTTYPNKVFDYMAAGRPVLLAIDGVIREVVERAGAGIFVPPGDRAALAKAVRALMEDRGAARAMGARGRRVVCEEFDRGLHAAQIERIFRRALPSSHAPSVPLPAIETGTRS